MHIINIYEQTEDIIRLVTTVTNKAKKPRYKYGLENVFHEQ